MEVLHLVALLALSSQVFVVNSQWFHESFSDNKFNVSWKYDTARDVLMFQVRAQTIGWVGLGFTTTNEGMKDLDVVVGGTSGGTDYLHDLTSNSKTKPTVDTTKNYNLTKAEEANGKTTLWFERARNTTDKQDQQFDTSIYLAYAYRNTDDAVDAANFNRHSERGYSSKKYDLLFQARPSPSAGGPNATIKVTSTPTSASSGDKSTPKPTSGEEKAVSSLISVALSILFLTIAVL